MVYFHISFSECFLSYCQPIVSTNFALKSQFVGFPLNITIKFAGLLTFLPMQARSQTTEHSTIHAISRQTIGGKAQKKIVILLKLSLLLCVCLGYRRSRARALAGIHSRFSGSLCSSFVNVYRKFSRFKLILNN